MKLDSGMMIFGILLGAVAGGLVTLLKAPKSGRALRQQLTASVGGAGQNLRTTVETVMPSDPLVESIAEGKAAARRRLAELG